jgi:nucleoid-associated protein YgaU
VVIAAAEAAAAAAEAAAAIAAAAIAAAEAAIVEAAAVEAAAAEVAAAEAAAAAAAAKVAAAEAAAAEQAAVEAAAAAAEAAAAEAAIEAAAEAAAARIAADIAAAEAAAAEQAAAEAAAVAGSAEPEISHFALSAPVIILPGEGAEAAPLLVKPGPEGVTLLQPAMTEPAAGIVLDRITYSEQGDLLAAGRGQPGAIVRIYANAMFVEEILCDGDGEWKVRIASEVAMAARLLRFDEVDAAGTVLSRLETPFEYSALATTLELRERKIVVQKGDHLWKFAEQHYGEGIRYSVIFSANSALIRDPDLIYPGQIFTVPELVDSQ